MERGCFWFCSVPNFWSDGLTPSQLKLSLVPSAPAIYWVNFPLAEQESDPQLPVVHYREVKAYAQAMLSKEEKKVEISPFVGSRACWICSDTSEDLSQTELEKDQAQEKQGYSSYLVKAH